MRPEAELDIELFSNWLLVGITDRATGYQWDYQMTADHPLDIAAIEALCRHYTLVTFNGANYDIPILTIALAGADNHTLKMANDDIIVRQMKWWTLYKKYGVRQPEYIDHIDVSEPTPGVRVSLKQYACRLSAPLVQDSPVDFNAPFPLEHVPDEIGYCRNDRAITRLIRDAIDDLIQLRIRMSARYGVDLRSKSGAQMAEAMVKSEWTRLINESLTRFDADSRALDPDDFALRQVAGEYPHVGLNYTTDYRGTPKVVVPHFQHGTTFKVKIPDHVEFVTPYMQSLLSDVRACDFMISDKDEAEILGHDLKNIRTGVLIPAELKGRDITIGRNVYRMGIGGLHSQESSVSYRSIPGVCTLRTADVASYYPSLIITAGLLPNQLGRLFMEIYKGAYVDRIAAKKALKSMPVDTEEYFDTKAIESGYKLLLNSVFGKLFSRFSIFYAPELGIAVTIGGQLSLLMLIERLEVSGIRVVSANTDGIEMLVPWGYDGVCDSILAWWQEKTALTLEGDNYLALYSRDVNNYISLQFDGSTKRKGVFGKSGLLQNKHPDVDVCSDAVVAFLCSGTPLEQTIRECREVTKFVRVRGAKGGAVWRRADGTTEHLGRAVRWYYAIGSLDYIIDGGSLNKVAGSDGARPVMELPDSLPTDIDYRYYVSVAEQMLNDIGYGRENQL